VLLAPDPSRRVGHIAVFAFGGIGILADVVGGEFAEHVHDLREARHLNFDRDRRRKVTFKSLTA
jgi:hypothetical protein